MPVEADLYRKEDLEAHGSPQIGYKANFLLLKWDDERLNAAATTTEIFEALRAMATAAAALEESARKSAKLMVIGAFANCYLEAPNDCEALKAHLRGAAAWATWSETLQPDRFTPADIVRAIDGGEFCGGAGYGALLRREHFQRMARDSLVVGIRNLGEGIDRTLWSAADLFGCLSSVLLSVGPARENAYHVTGTAAPAPARDRSQSRTRDRSRSPRR